MGVDVQTCRFLCFARGRGVDFSRTLTVGRQNLYLTARELRETLAVAGIALGLERASALVGTPERRGFAEEVLRELGAAEVDSIDASPYEGASRVWDLNEPVGAELHARYSMVFDGGTLEHVFNYPVALRSCMEMVRAGGHLLAVTPANNHFGHGFYQLGPDLFHRALSPENGFRVRHLLLFDGDGAWYAVKDPAAVGGRVTVRGARPASLAVIAVRDEVVPLFRSWPQQSDYVVAWSPIGTGEQPRGLKRRVIDGLPMSVRRAYRRLSGVRLRRFPSDEFTPVRWDARPELDEKR